MRFLTALALVPVVFAPHHGWYTGHTRVHRCPGVSANRCVQATSWAATIPWHGCADCLPHAMIAALPPDGIVLQVGLSEEHPLVGRRAGAWPPTIGAGNLSGIEGVSGRYGVFQLFARYGQRDSYVWAFFGRARPTRAQLAAANAELRTALMRSR
jgi:hypothetical protein